MYTDLGYKIQGKTAEILFYGDMQFFKPVTYSNFSLRLASIIIAPILYAVASVYFLCLFFASLLELVFNVGFVENTESHPLFRLIQLCIALYATLSSFTINLLDFIGGLLNKKDLENQETPGQDLYEDLVPSC